MDGVTPKMTSNQVSISRIGHKELKVRAPLSVDYNGWSLVSFRRVLIPRAIKLL
ncbi:hypothetical protein VCR4J2_120036 [Vibrio coralliirubri]|nr:hypothetical protein VCR4J2_120036 [Vibrio coralliirubri]